MNAPPQQPAERPALRSSKPGWLRRHVLGLPLPLVFIILLTSLLPLLIALLVVPLRLR